MAEVLASLLTSAKDKLSAVIANQAEKRSVKEKLVQQWLKRLKNAALDISDMLEDYQDTSDRINAKVSSSYKHCMSA
jgi:hypothetical protein